MKGCAQPHRRTAYECYHPENKQISTKRNCCPTFGSCRCLGTNAGLRHIHNCGKTHLPRSTRRPRRSRDVQETPAGLGNSQFSKCVFCRWAITIYGPPRMQTTLSYKLLGWIVQRLLQGRFQMTWRGSLLLGTRDTMWNGGKHSTAIATDHCRYIALHTAGQDVLHDVYSPMCEPW